MQSVKPINSPRAVGSPLFTQSTLSSVEQAKTASDESLKSKEAELLALKEASAKDQDKLRELVDLMQSLYARVLSSCTF